MTKILSQRDKRTYVVSQTWITEDFQTSRSFYFPVGLALRPETYGAQSKISGEQNGLVIFMVGGK